MSLFNQEKERNFIKSKMTEMNLPRHNRLVDRIIHCRELFEMIHHHHRAVILT